MRKVTVAFALVYLTVLLFSIYQQARFQSTRNTPLTRKLPHHAPTPRRKNYDPPLQETNITEQEKDLKYRVAGLDCSRYGGPLNPSEVVYWKDIPQDNSFISPLASTSVVEEDKYVTFEPDEGGFNNVRMALETVITMTIAIGRILVLPPSQGMYLLDDEKNRFSFADFYPLEAIAQENKALKFMSMQQFLQKQELFVNRSTGRMLEPPQKGRTKWDGASEVEIQELNHWLRWIGSTPQWSTSDCVVGFSVKEEEITSHVEAAITRNQRDRSAGRKRKVAVPVNSATPLLYQKSWVIDLKFACMTRRGKITYREGATGDFKVAKMLLDASEIYANVHDILDEKLPIYIATDEQNRSFFEPFHQHHKELYLSDFKHLIPDLNTNYYGLVEQLVAARGRHFVGVMFSTMTGFITRLRGYYATRDKLVDHESGALSNTFYYAPARAKTLLRTYSPFTKPLQSREYPMAWRDIDHDVSD